MARIRQNEWTEYEEETGTFIFDTSKMKNLDAAKKEAESVSLFQDRCEPVESSKNEHEPVPFIRELYENENKSEEFLQEAESNFRAFIKVSGKVISRIAREEQAKENRTSEKEDLSF